jgi:hypothetical protein
VYLGQRMNPDSFSQLVPIVRCNQCHIVSSPSDRFAFLVKNARVKRWMDGGEVRDYARFGAQWFSGGHGEERAQNQALKLGLPV